VSAKATADKSEDVRINSDDLKFSPPKAVTPAVVLVDRLYSIMPDVSITGPLPRSTSGLTSAAHTWRADR
jgi:hypothetical protein